MNQTPGWYPDPLARHLQRYWNGREWTQQVVDVDPQSPPTAVSYGARGWRSDPTWRFRLRYWDGTAWTDQVAFTDPLPVHVVPQPTAPAVTETHELDHLTYTRGFLDDAYRSGTLGVGSYRELLSLVDERIRRLSAPATGPAVAPPPSVPVASVPVTAAPVTAVSTTPAPTSTARVAQPATPCAPDPSAPSPSVPAPSVPSVPTWADLARNWIGETASAVRSDLALHGLAYLGVLLLFAGVFGFVAFTFGQVSRDLRPVAEVAIPTSIFLASWFLRRRGAPYVANALELLGGAVLPIVVFAAFVDGSDVPSDFTGGALEVALAVTAFALAALYALFTVRRPTTMLRFLVAPLVWLGVMAAMLSTDPHLRGGEEITRPLPWQTAVTLAAIAITAFVARRWRGHPLTDASALVVLPGTVVVVVLEVLSAAREHWPVGPTVLASLALITILELQADRLGPTITVVAQGVTLAGGTAMLGPSVELGWLGVATTASFLLLIEWDGHRRAEARVVPVLLLGVVAGLGLAATEPWPMVIAFGVASAWAVTRRVARPTWLPEVEASDLVVVALLLGVAYGLYDAVATVAATLTLAAGVFLAALVVRVTPAREDPLWHWSIPTAAGALVGAIIVGTPSWSSTDCGILAGAALLTGGAFVLSSLRGSSRVWGASAAGTLAFGYGCVAVGLGAGPAAIVAAAVGAALVAVALDRRIAVAGDLGIVGHVLTVGALVPAAVAGGWFAVIGLGIVAGAAVVTTVAQETRGSAVADRLGEYTGALRRRRGPTWVPTVLAFVATVTFVVVVLDQLGWAEVGADGGFVALAAIALGTAAVARFTRERVRVSSTAAWTAFATALLALSCDGDTGGAITAAMGVATVAVLPARRRPALMVWAAWAMTGIATVRGAIACGLDSDHAELAWFAWGAAALITVLTLDRRAPGDRARLGVVRDDRRLVPFLLGAGAFVISSVRAYDQWPDSFGWWSLAIAVSLAVMAVVAEAPFVGVFASAAAIDASARLLPWPLPDQPWNLLVAVVGLSVIASALQARSRDRAWWMRWDLWPFVAANGGAIAIVATAPATTTPAAAYLAVGAWALAIGAVTRRWPWLLAGAVLVNVGAAWLGSGWLALALLMTASGVMLAATRAHGVVRTALQVGGAATVAGAWVSALWWLDVGMEPGIAASAVVAGAVVLLGAMALRWKILGSDWSGAWCAVGLASLGAATGTAVALAPRSLAIPVGAAYPHLAAASAAAARPTSWSWLRDAAAVLFVGGSTAVVAGIDVAAAVAVTAACALGFGATAVAALLAYRRPTSPWTMPVAEVGALAAAVAIAVGSGALPDVGLLVPALAVAGAEAAVLGAVTRRTEVLAAAPVFLCASWLTFASDALTGNPEWFTIPIGITLLVIEAIVRAAIARRGERPGPPAIVAVDFVGMAFVVGAALVQTVATSLWYGVMAVALGVVLTGWGIVTRVRRRALFGAATVVVASILLVGIPLADVALADRGNGGPLEGPALWLVIAGIGMVAIVVAAFLEQGRRRVRETVDRIADLTRDWE